MNNEGRTIKVLKSFEGYKQYIEDKLPYKIIRKKNKYNNKQHWELWTVDEKRNLVECILEHQDKKFLEEYVKEITQ